MRSSILLAVTEKRVSVPESHKNSCVSLQPIVILDGGDVPPIVNHYTAFSDRYTVFSSFYR